MKVRVLGCSGAIARDCRTTSFLVNHNILIDAGTGVGDLTLEEMRQIDHVFLTHSHLDHIAALPLMLDAVSSLRSQPVQVHAPAATIAALRMSSTTSSGLISVASPLRSRPFCGTYPWPLARPSLLLGWWCGCCQPCTACRL